MQTRQTRRKVKKRNPTIRRRSLTKLRKNAPTQVLSRRERRELWRLVICGGAFLLLVVVKLILPSRLEAIGGHVTRALEENMDVQAVFASVGRAASGEEELPETLAQVCQAVFGPDGGQAVETAALSREGYPVPSALELLRESSGASPAAEPRRNAPYPSNILYSKENLPPHVSMEQEILGFDYTTPVAGELSSGFGYRVHPVNGEERFHYGIDLAAETGTTVVAFADGTVSAVGESSSYGIYLIVRHEGGYETLYAHCSQVSVPAGRAVRRGEKIAEVGATGMATGPHLHLELHRDGTYLNPVYYVHHS